MVNDARDFSDASKSILDKSHCLLIVPVTVYEIKNNLSFESRIAACMPDIVSVLTVSTVDDCSFSDVLFSFCNSKKVSTADTGCGLKAKASTSFDDKSTIYSVFLNVNLL